MKIHFQLQEDQNIIVVNWARLSSNDYYSTVKKSRSVGYSLSRVL